MTATSTSVGGTLILEIIPWDRSRVFVPEVGRRIEVVGPWVDDTAHGWNEIHPAWWISGGTIQPASADQLRRVDRLLHGLEPAAVEDDGGAERLRTRTFGNNRVAELRRRTKRWTCSNCSRPHRRSSPRAKESSPPTRARERSRNGSTRSESSRRRRRGAPTASCSSRRRA